MYVYVCERESAPLWSRSILQAGNQGYYRGSAGSFLCGKTLDRSLGFVGKLLKLPIKPKPREGISTDLYTKCIHFVRGCVGMPSAYADCLGNTRLLTYFNRMFLCVTIAVPPLLTICMPNQASFHL